MEDCQEDMVVTEGGRWYNSSDRKSGDWICLGTDFAETNLPTCCCCCGKTPVILTTYLVLIRRHGDTFIHVSLLFRTDGQGLVVRQSQSCAICTTAVIEYISRYWKCMDLLVAASKDSHFYSSGLLRVLQDAYFYLVSPLCNYE